MYFLDDLLGAANQRRTAFDRVFQGVEHYGH
ncbi:uncharacterized protein METZ01_LOCUS295239, partial [marine metagenome]